MRLVGKGANIIKPVVQDGWMGDLTRILKDPSIDGIFIDANIKLLLEGWGYLKENEKQAKRF